MNAYDKRYDIRLATYEEIDEIMAFIKEYWNEKHILANNRKYFEYEYVKGKEVHFVIAKEIAGGSIAGILGYIPAAMETENSDIWTVMWKVKNGVMPLLGMELFYRVKDLAKARYLFGVGENPHTTIRLLNKLTKFETARMKQFYRLSKEKEFKIAGIVNPVYSVCENSECDSTVVVIQNQKDLQRAMKTAVSESLPCKDMAYISHRYLENPVYHYYLYGVMKTDKVGAVLIMREQKYMEARVMRIIDYIGDQSLFSGLTHFFEDILNTYEYVDFYELGFNEKYILEAGFIERKENDNNIIPNYFNPYVKENIDIWCSGSVKSALYFKGDADQDRPNEF